MVDLEWARDLCSLAIGLYCVLQNVMIERAVTGLNAACIGWL